MNILDVKLETKRLIMRKLCKDDVEDMFEYTSNQDVTKYLSWEAHTEISQARHYIESVISEYDSLYSYTWAIELKEIKKFIGIVRIFDVSYSNKRGELSYILNPNFQGKGFIMEAITSVIDLCFNKVELNRIQARCTTDNFSSERVMQKLGMKYEGTLKEYWINKGVPTDAKIYALSEKNYLNK